MNERSDLAGHLRAAQAESFSGGLDVLVNGGLVGQVLFKAGQVAWATSKAQPENLGTFLWRLGHITRTQLGVVANLYEAHRGQKKFGEILDSLGLMSAPTLRRCLLLHTRSALRALLASEPAQIRVVPGALADQRDTSFTVDEVLDQGSAPQLPDRDTPRPQEGEGPERLGALKPLRTVPGYRAAGLFSADGEVLAIDACTKVEAELLAATICSVVENASRATLALPVLGALHTTVMTCAQGCLVSRWLDDTRKNVVAIAVAGHNPLAVLVTLERSLPRLLAFVSDLSLAAYFKNLLRQATTEREQAQALKTAIRVRLRELRRSGGDDIAAKKFEDAIDLLQTGDLAAALKLFHLGLPHAEEVAKSAG